MIVSDAGPIIIFARVGRLQLLHDVVGSVLIPRAVFDEIVAKKGGAPRRAELTRSSWIERTSVAGRSKLDRMPNVLHQGEREAIALAEERGAQLLIDEIRGRRAATERGVEVIGTLRILSYAKQLRRIAAVRPVVAQMQSEGYRFDRAVISRFLEIIGEA